MESGRGILAALNEYCARQGLTPTVQLGFGKDGIVWATDRSTAVKAHERAHTYERERAAYLRLRDHDVRRVHWHAVPRLVSFDDGLMAIQMTIVRPPFLLDFGSAWLDEGPDFGPEVIREWRREKRAQFGARWGDVEGVLEALRRRHGVVMLDVHPGNVRFE